MMSPDLSQPPQCSAQEKVARAEAAARSVFQATYGHPVFIRIIKEDRVLELWAQSDDGVWRTLKTYPIAGMSGTLGPKLREGDGQAPEGFYQTTRPMLNPHSRYHLSFNIGYPNAHDRALGRTGSYIMVHGGDASTGCFAMTDPGIEEIYGMVTAALQQGQEAVPIQVYPFVMTTRRLQEEAASPHVQHWHYLQPGWQHTEHFKEPYTPATL